MSKPEFLRGDSINEIIDQCCGQERAGVLSFLSRGKWQTMDVVFESLTQKTVHFKIMDAAKAFGAKLQTDQPVGISFQDEQSKCIFESVIVAFSKNFDHNGPQVVVQMPDRVEKVARRTFSRACVPDSMRVEVIFWHRGYTFECQESPSDQCWQGELVDISAGGMQVAVEAAKKDQFTEGQLIGLQFTPMSYQVPIVVEGHIRYLADIPQKDKIYLGVEYVGLEASLEGREKLRRIVNTVETYQENDGRVIDEPMFDPQPAVKN